MWCFRKALILRSSAPARVAHAAIYNSQSYAQGRSASWQGPRALLVHQLAVFSS